MQRFLILWLSLAAVLAGPATTWAMTSTSRNLAVSVTPGQTDTNQTITSVQLSGSSVLFSASGPYYLGTLTTNLSPQTPTFNNLNGASYQLVASGGSCSGGDTTHFQISGDGVYTNALAAGTYKLCITASATGVTPFTATFTGITEGNKIDAVASYCAANGGGNGTSGSPWQDACIKAAENAAVNGDTVFLQAGNWSLPTNGTFVTTSKSINLVGAGSGNTFDAYGHPSNASSTDLCPSTSMTCVATTGSSTCATQSGGSPQGNACTGGAVSFTNCSNVVVTHINFDGSNATAGGDADATLNFRDCPGPLAVDDIRLLTYNQVAVNVPETQFFPTSINIPQSSCTAAGSTGLNVKNSIFALPTGNTNGPANVFEDVFVSGAFITNNVFWQFGYNPTDDDCIVFTGNVETLTSGTWAYKILGPTGCDFDPGNTPGYTCPTNGGSVGQQGSFHATFANNYLNATGQMLGIGGGVNDPSGAGGISDLHYTGNWVFATTGAIDSCTYRIQGGNNCTGTFGSGIPTGNAINATASSACASSNNGYPFDITNNSIVATTSAQLNMQGTGGSNCNNTTNFPTFVYGVNATKNYFSGPNSTGGVQYNSNANTVSPVVTGNYCAGGQTFTQTDSTTCATTGFTTQPTVSFTLGSLYYDTIRGAFAVPFTTTNFSAQYGAVQWLTSTSSTPPTPSGQSGTGATWSYVPPVSLSNVAHGNTVYIWVMDSANNISPPASAVIP